jgi:hypothetical protein
MAATGISPCKEIPTMPQPTTSLTVNEVTFLLTLLRNTSTPLTTQDLVDALKNRAARS